MYMAIWVLQVDVSTVDTHTNHGIVSVSCVILSVCTASLDRFSAKPVLVGGRSAQEEPVERDEDSGTYSNKCDNRVSCVLILHVQSYILLCLSICGKLIIINEVLIIKCEGIHGL